MKTSKFSRGDQSGTITVDYGDSIKEISPFGESNNTIDYDFFMPSNSLTALNPPKDGIVPLAEAKLQVQASNILSENVEVIFEIDTTPLFNSPLLQNSGIVVGSNIIEHKFLLPPFDSTDFFWRARFNKSINEGGTWETSTFSLIYDSPEGWSQGYFTKLGEATQLAVKIDSPKHALVFRTSISEKFDMFLGGIDLSITYRGLWAYDETQRGGVNGTGWKSYGNYTSNGLEVMAVNPNNLERFSEQGSDFNRTVSGKYAYGGLYHTGGEKSGVYIFSMTNPSDRDSFDNFINRIPDSFWVYVIIHGDVDKELWSESTLQAFESIGSNHIRTIGHGEPYGLIGIKGGGPVSQQYESIPDYASSVDPKSQTGSISAIMEPSKTNGHLTSTKVGPSQNWKEFYYRLESSDSPSDSISYTIIGVDTADNDVDLFIDVQPGNLDLSSVDADRFPFLKIKTHYKDIVKRTPIQQKRWTLLYDGVPEGSLMPNIAFEQSADTIQEGDSLAIKIAYQNISDLSMDSVLVLSLNRKSDNSVDTVSFVKFPPLEPNESFVISNKISTLNQEGSNRITIYVNPDFNQPEVRLDNNVIDLKYVVEKDEKNPILDVVFDGVHIIDYDIVSPSPVITMSVLDDNNFIFIQDPESFEATVQEVDDIGNPIGNIDTIRHTWSNVTFSPANGPGDKAILEYSPTDLASGKYRLNVSVKDASGNESSDLNYVIHFEVVRESKITNFYPYPNPFTTSMKFVYTLTGEQIPDYMKIQILTVTGKVVREITQDELGHIKIGNNISEYAWNGTDEFGDQLANGVYLYRVVAKINGEDIDQRETAGDQFFNQGFGKIYLMR